MKSMIFTLLFSLLIAASGYSASAKSFKRSDFISAAQIQKPGGYKVRIPRIGKVSIKKAVSKRFPKKKCLVHKASVVREIKRKLRNRKGKQKAIQPLWIKLKADYDTLIGPICVGSGSGCTILVIVPTP